MNNYLEEIDNILTILKKENKDIVIRQIENGKRMGGTGGEILAIICSLLKTYEISDPDFFGIIRKPAYELYRHSESICQYPSANFALLEELSNHI